MALLTVDSAYGYAELGEEIVHEPPDGVHTALWRPPRSQGMHVAAMLSGGQGLSYNLPARQVPTLRPHRLAEHVRRR